MPVLALIDAAALLPRAARCIGLDLGTKTIGVAASDPDRRVAAPVETIARARFQSRCQAHSRTRRRTQSRGLVLGLPINMDGSEGPRAQSTRAFARNLAQLTDLPIALWDERLSTAAVERALIEADASRAKRKAVIDQHAATFILQGALDRLARGQIRGAVSLRSGAPMSRCASIDISSESRRSLPDRAGHSRPAPQARDRFAAQAGRRVVLDICAGA